MLLQRLEVAGACEAVGCRRVLPLGHRPPFDAERTAGGGAAQWQVADGAGRDYARQRADPLRHVAAECLSNRRAVEIRLRQRHRKDDHVLRVEPRIVAEYPHEALDHQPGRDEHHDRQRDFGRHERRSDGAHPSCHVARTAGSQIGGTAQS